MKGSGFVDKTRFKRINLFKRGGINEYGVFTAFYDDYEKILERVFNVLLQSRYKVL